MASLAASRLQRVVKVDQVRVAWFWLLEDPEVDFVLDFATDPLSPSLLLSQRSELPKKIGQHIKGGVQVASMGDECSRTATTIYDTET